MSSPKPGPSNEQSTILNIEASDIANSGPFMDSLVAFLNEASICVQEVKQRSGLSAGCLSPVVMNEEEKHDKLSSIVSTLSQKCQLEVSKQETLYESAESNNTAYASANSSGAFRSPPPCICPPDLGNTPPRHILRGRRAGTPRPGTSPVRGRVATPDQYFVPITQSSMNSSGFSRQGVPCPTTSRLASTGRSDPYSTMMDSGGMPGAYSRGPGGFDDVSSSQRARNYSSYVSSSPGDGSCPPECAQTINSSGRQDYRRFRG